MGVYRNLDGVPAALDSAYHELKNPPEESPDEIAVIPLDEKVSAG
ncbi:hypothetical protein [Mycobacterium sp.]